MIQSMTSINNYLKMQRMKMLAQNRMKDYSSGTMDDKAAREAKELKQAEIGWKINAISGRLKAGKKLSGSDMAFLRKHAPDLYEKAVKIARERDEYRRRLDKAKTKDDADRVHMRKMQQMSMEAKHSDADPEFMNMRVAAILDERGSYVTNGSYSRLKREHVIDLEKTKERKAEEKKLADKLTKKELEEEEKAAKAEKAGEERAKAGSDNAGAAADKAQAGEKSASAADNGKAAAKTQAGTKPEAKPGAKAEAKPEATGKSAEVAKQDTPRTEGQDRIRLYYNGSSAAAKAKAVAMVRGFSADNVSIRAAIAAASAKPPASSVAVVAVKPAMTEAPSGSQGSATRKKAAANYMAAARQGEAVLAAVRSKKKA